MKHKTSFLFAVVAIWAFGWPGFSAIASGAQPEVIWNGGAIRILARVAPRKLDGRVSDECPANLVIDFQAELRKLSLTGRPDITTLRIARYDPKTGRPMADGKYAYGKDEGDRPFRWYDAAIPYDFPEFADAVSRTGGKIARKPRIRGGYFFNAIGDWRSGQLAWLHNQDGEQSSYYAITFDLLGDGRKPRQLPPRAWLGDGLPRCDQRSESTMGADHCRVALDDWDQDGLVDLIVGEHYGHVFWWPNLGTKKRPLFRFARFIHADGKPLDAGIAAAPKVVDWDGDGAKDLLVGTHWNRLLFYKNTGTNDARRLEYRGPVLVDGRPLELPLRPIERGSADVFRRDYYPVPETVDWDDDGDIDLLMGGYITGSIFFYENTARADDGTPRLMPRGPITVGNRAINVGHWCAAPCAADFNADGELDLMSGNMPMYLTPDERQQSSDDFIRFYTTAGNTEASELMPTTFPGKGRFPRERLATPRTFDWDNDGDLDLVVSARENIFLYENKGSRTKPDFAMHSNPLTVPWGLAPIAVDQFRDWNGDGRLDLIKNYTVHLNAGVGNPYAWSEREAVLPEGQHIAHPSGIGDDWFWPSLDDFDRDGKIDVLFGDWYGNIWFHQNRSDGRRRRFDVNGIRFRLTDGSLLKVGPMNKDPSEDFTALQGARTVFAVDDFDRDGFRDLIVGDTYGKIRYFRNRGTNGHETTDHAFLQPMEIADLGIRGLVDATDWNNDGWPDVIASAANGRVRVLLNRAQATGRRFTDGFAPDLPPIVQPRVLMADLNGDGDEDLFLPSTQGSCFVERSFLENGYAEAQLIRIEQAR